MKNISGRDSVSIPRKYKSDWDGVLPGRILLVSNNQLRLDDDSGVIADRTIAIHLTQSFLGRENLKLIDELARELPGIFNRVRAAWLRLRQRGHFVLPQSARQVVDEVRAGASPMSEFLAESYEVGSSLFEIDADELWRSWQ